MLEQIDKYLPHILYGAEGAHAAEKQQRDRVEDASMLPGMQIAGGLA